MNFEQSVRWLFLETCVVILVVFFQLVRIPSLHFFSHVVGLIEIWSSVILLCSRSIRQHGLELIKFFGLEFQQNYSVW